MEKRGRVMDANEAFAVLQKTAGHKSPPNWFEPFYPAMFEAVRKGLKTIVMGGKRFDIRKYGKDYVFMVDRGFVPMTRMSLDSLIEKSADALNSSQ